MNEQKAAAATPVDPVEASERASGCRVWLEAKKGAVPKMEQTCKQCIQDSVE